MDCTSEQLSLDNRRQASRLNRQFPISYQLAGQRPAPGVALNVNGGGARLVLRGSRTNLTSEAILLHLENAVSLKARAVWQEARGDCSIVGVTFEALGRQEKIALRYFLSRLGTVELENP